MLSPLGSKNSLLCCKKKKIGLDDVEVLKVVNKPMNVSPHVVHGCETRARSRSDNFTVQRMEQHACNTHSSSFV